MTAMIIEIIDDVHEDILRASCLASACKEANAISKRESLPFSRLSKDWASPDMEATSISIFPSNLPIDFKVSLFMDSIFFI